MKKKKLSKKLALGKKQISNLGNVNGGAPASHLTCTVTRDIIICGFTRDIRTCTWHSELYTACDCPPSWETNCGSQLIRCDVSVNIPCEA